MSTIQQPEALRASFTRHPIELATQDEGTCRLLSDGQHEIYDPIRHRFCASEGAAVLLRQGLMEAWDRRNWGHQHRPQQPANFRDLAHQDQDFKAILYANTNPESITTLEGIELSVRRHILETVSPQIDVVFSAQVHKQQPVKSADSEAVSR